MRYTLVGVLALLCAMPCAVFSQDAAGTVDKMTAVPSGFFQKINDRASGLNNKITRQTERYLRRLAREEDGIRRKLYRHDSAAAARLFGNNSINYKTLLQSLQSRSGQPGGIPIGAGGDYLPYFDSIKTSLHFLQQNKDLSLNSARQQEQIAAALTKVNQLQDKIQITGQIRQLISQRKEQIRQTLSGYTHIPASLKNRYQGYSHEAYYYGAQLKSYADELNNPDKLTKRALGILDQSPQYQAFLKSHSELAGLFSLPGGGESNPAKALAGLQTRSGVQQQLQGKIAAGGPGAQEAVQQKIQFARGELKKLQDKVSQAGGGNSSMEVPDFRPNSQRTRSLWGRLEWGVNLQSLPSNYAFPATSDLGGSLGYKLNDGNTFGIGASFKVGWGRDISHISISSNGFSLRSFWEMKIKGSLHISGGLEYNHMTPFTSLQQVRHLGDWTPSGLIGVSKTISAKSRVFKKTKLQLLWDFLSYSQPMKTQAFIFRIGYVWR